MMATGKAVGAPASNRGDPKPRLCPARGPGARGGELEAEAALPRGPVVLPVAEVDET